jgi:hypothetical protein
MCAEIDIRAPPALVVALAACASGSSVTVEDPAGAEEEEPQPAARIATAKAAASAAGRRVKIRTLMGTPWRVQASERILVAAIGGWQGEL